jgi:hypothetical protein
LFEKIEYQRMDELIRLLQQFESDTSLTYSEDEFISNTEIGAIASDILIDKDGSCNWDNIIILDSNGFSVIPIEKDSFGWLIGGILTKKGIITYG